MLPALVHISNLNPRVSESLESISVIPSIRSMNCGRCASGWVTLNGLDHVILLPGKYQVVSQEVVNTVPLRSVSERSAFQLGLDDTYFQFTTVFVFTLVSVSR